MKIKLIVNICLYIFVCLLGFFFTIFGNKLHKRKEKKETEEKQILKEKRLLNC